MKNKNEVSLFDQMDTKMNVGLDEVVNVFVSEYETNLHTEKNRLSKLMRETKSELKQFIADLELNLRTANKKYETKIELLGLESYVNSVSPNWDKGTYVTVIRIKSTDPKDKGDMSRRYIAKLTAKDVKRNKTLNEEIDVLNKELQTILAKIKDVSRKERQVRGEISRRKLENAGMDSLLGNKEMLKLIQVDS